MIADVGDPQCVVVVALWWCVTLFRLETGIALQEFLIGVLKVT